MRSFLHHLLVVVLSTVSSVVVFLEPIGATRASARTADARTSLLVASANVREGSRVLRQADNRDADDRRVFARRLLNRGHRVPDVVLLQEAVGTAGAFARALNAHPRAKRRGARYAVAVGTSNRPAHRCDGRRGRHRLIRDGAILVNRQTIGRVQRRGYVRTWGRWPRAKGMATLGCAEQAWLLLRVRDGLPGQRLARVANIHLAPMGRVLKTRAVQRVLGALTRVHRRTPDAMLVMGGDFNLTRCRGRSRTPERGDCVVRVAHRQILDHGFRDAIRSERTRDVVGVRHRIDFVYTQGRVASTWWDRCYRAFLTTRPACRPAASRFATQQGFARCQVRSDRVGSPGGGCSPRRYGRYYSDHPILRTLLAWK